ncbi:MAG: hypothetical protein JRJ37_08815, partial [Deltaproteobacteria bacterium]|nr:hypothetical protein [Deltaproteobacteria bacterium]
MKSINAITAAMIVGLGLSCGSPDISAASEIIHDAEYYILESQNGEKWAKADIGLSKKLAALKMKFGTTPNIIYILWDDQQVGA